MREIKELFGQVSWSMVRHSNAASLDYLFNRDSQKMTERKEARETYEMI
jgi:hypothetical protein